MVKDEKDPLESAKAPEPKPKTRVKKPPPPKVEAEPPPKVAPPVVVKDEKFVVTNKITVSWGPQMLKLTPGKVVSDALYGPGAVEALRNAGVSLKPHEE
jgi:hypothetical protein